MNNQKRRKREEKLIDDIFSPKGVNFTRPNGQRFNTRDMATRTMVFEDPYLAIVCLYAVYHSEGMVNPEYSVFNPRPSKPVGQQILPADSKLTEDQEMLQTMDLEEHMKYCVKLIREKKVPAIGVVAGLEPTDTIRLTAMSIFDARLSKLCGGPSVMFSVTGGNREQNQDYMDQAMQAVQRCLEAHDLD